MFLKRSPQTSRKSRGLRFYTGTPSHALHARPAEQEPRPAPLIDRESTLSSGDATCQPAILRLKASAADWSSFLPIEGGPRTAAGPLRPTPTARSHPRQHTPDFDRFHSSPGLPPKAGVVQSRHCGSSARWYDLAMAADRRNRRRAEPVCRPDRRVLVASPVRRGRTARAGGMDPCNPRRPSGCQPGATSCCRPTRQPSGPWLFTGFCTAGQEAVPQHVDDARSARQLGPFVTSIGLVGAAGVVCRARVSAGRRPPGRIRGRLCQPRYVDPALRHPLLIGRRRAVVPSDSAL